MRNHSHFGGPPADYQSWHVRHRRRRRRCSQLDDAYANWIAGVRGLDDDGAGAAVRTRRRPVGRLSDVSALILHINREVIHHGAEIACIRDLYAHSHREEGEQ